MTLTEIERLILKGTGDAHSDDAQALRVARDQDVIMVAAAMSDLHRKGLVDANGFPTADGIRAVWGTWL